MEKAKMAEPIISIRDLSYRYRGQKRPALSGISLDIDQGEFVVIMGPSEAGKSTLAACLNGLIPHFHKGTFRGQVTVMGCNTGEHAVAELAERVGMVFQDFEAQLFSTSVELEVAFGPENLAVPRDEIAERIDENLRLVGLEKLRKRPPSTLSGGQKQKLAIASVLAMRSRILVMDEPTTDLDPISKLGVIKIADQLRQRDDITLILVEHETEEALHADRLLLLKDGCIVRFGPAREVLREVDLLEENGVMPLGVPKFFHQMGASELPLTPEEGLKQFRANGWRLSESRFAELVARDNERSQRHGQVLIRCAGLEHSYANGFKALQGVDLEIRRGEMVAIVGQNGSGKTTLVKHFNGLLMPTKGSVEVDGKATREQGVFLLGQKVGYVFQNPDHQIFSDTVFDEVAFSLRLRKASEAQIKERVSEALAAVGLVGYEQEDPFSLTKGGRQRVAIASVLAARPEVIILDEPTTGLDYTEQRDMMDLVRQLNEQGSTIIFVTHHMWVVAEYAHRVFVMRDGRVFLRGTAREVLAHEEELRNAYLQPPHLVTLANSLGKTLLNSDEMVYCVERGLV
jgi:energy-coupling factor transporter ATP-binding protein EcfA2